VHGPRRRDNTLCIQVSTHEVMRWITYNAHQSVSIPSLGPFSFSHHPPPVITKDCTTTGAAAADADTKGIAQVRKLHMLSQSSDLLLRLLVVHLRFVDEDGMYAEKGQADWTELPWQRTLSRPRGHSGHCLVRGLIRLRGQSRRYSFFNWTCLIATLLPIVICS